MKKIYVLYYIERKALGSHPMSKIITTIKYLDLDDGFDHNILNAKQFRNIKDLESITKHKYYKALKNELRLAEIDYDGSEKDLNRIGLEMHKRNQWYRPISKEFDEANNYLKRFLDACRTI